MKKLLKDRIDKNRVLAVMSTIVLTVCIYRIWDLESKGKHSDATPYWTAISSIVFYWVPSPSLQFKDKKDKDETEEERTQAFKDREYAIKDKEYGIRDREYAVRDREYNLRDREYKQDRLEQEQENKGYL